MKLDFVGELDFKDEIVRGLDLTEMLPVYDRISIGTPKIQPLEALVHTRWTKGVE